MQSYEIYMQKTAFIRVLMMNNSLPLVDKKYLLVKNDLLNSSTMKTQISILFMLVFLTFGITNLTAQEKAHFSPGAQVDTRIDNMGIGKNAAGWVW